MRQTRKVDDDLGNPKLHVIWISSDPISNMGGTQHLSFGYSSAFRIYACNLSCPVDSV